MDSTRKIRLYHYNDKAGVLAPLVEVLEKLEDILYNQEEGFSEILEIIYHHEFLFVDTNYDGYQPKWIIQTMMENYWSMVDCMHLNPDEFKETFIYTYTCLHSGKRKTFTFSNNMPLDLDIVIICHLYYLMSRCKADNVKPVKELITLMKHKYKIETELKAVPNSQNSNIVTFCRIAHSFPSVTLDIFDNVTKSNSCFLFAQFPVLHGLPEMTCSSMIPSLLPQLPNPPLAVLLVVAIILDRNQETSLLTIYQNIYSAYRFSKFPENLKLQLCLKWNIVVQQHNTYMFNFHFALCRQEAKRIIGYLKSEESCLNYILSLI